MKRILLSILDLMKDAVTQAADDFTREHLQEAIYLIENVLETE